MTPALSSLLLSLSSPAAGNSSQLSPLDITLSPFVAALAVESGVALSAILPVVYIGAVSVVSPPATRVNGDSRSDSMLPLALGLSFGIIFSCSLAALALLWWRNHRHPKPLESDAPSANILPVEIVSGVNPMLAMKGPRGGSSSTGSADVSFPAGASNPTYKHAPPAAGGAGRTVRAASGRSGASTLHDSAT